MPQQMYTACPGHPGFGSMPGFLQHLAVRAQNVRPVERSRRGAQALWSIQSYWENFEALPLLDPKNPGPDEYRHGLHELPQVPTSTLDGNTLHPREAYRSNWPRSEGAPPE